MSFRVDGRVLLLLGGMVVALLAVTGAALLIGATSILTPGELVTALFSSSDSDAGFAVRELRLPRVLAGVIVGLSLGISGAIFQTVARNGLVSPDIVGVNSGASLAALVVIVLGTQARGAGDAQEVPLSLIAPAALFGAFAAAILVYVLGYVKGLNPYRLVLVGIGVTAVLAAGIAYALTLTRFPFATQLAFRWTVGSMYGTDWTEVRPALIACAVAVLVALALLRPLGILSLGDDTAAGLGSRVERDRFRLIAIGVVLAAVAVALAGPVGFVAFIAPHIARGLMGGRGPLTVIAAGLAGAILTAFADLVALRAVPGVDIPVGAVTALMGAPYFLFLLHRTNRLGVTT
ncbi:MAG TPA: iron ABC transporter permease [Candidatus Limnocylindria bacterium]|nr:iron ABC transporter permease [Candidatus Limnocylindria bacterium]